MDNIYGHNVQKQILFKHIQGRRIFPAYLFYGPSMIGKKSLALEFAKLINADNKHNLFFYDLNAYLDDAFTVEKFREVKKNFYLRPLGNSLKITIFDNFEYCSDIIQNSLLKIIEEPPSGNIFIFVSQLDVAVQTLMSRFFKIKFKALDNQNLQHFIRSQNETIDDNFLNRVVSYSGGKPGIAAALLKDQRFFQKQNIFLSNLENVLKSSLIKRLNFFTKYLDIEDKTQIILHLDILIAFLRNLILRGRDDAFVFAKEAEFILKAKSFIIKDKGSSLKLLIDALAFKTLK